MRFWVLDASKRDAQGPYEVADLKKLPGFSGESLVAPDGANDANAWRPAQSCEEIQGQFVKAPPVPRRPEPLPLPVQAVRPSSDAPFPSHEKTGQRGNWLGIASLGGIITICGFITWVVITSHSTSEGVAQKAAVSVEDTARRAAEQTLMTTVPMATRIVESQVIHNMGRPLSVRADSPIRLVSVCIMIESKNGSDATALGTYVMLVFADDSGNVYHSPDKKGSEPIKVSNSREGGMQFSCDDVRNSGKF